MKKHMLPNDSQCIILDAFNGSLYTNITSIKFRPSINDSFLLNKAFEGELQLGVSAPAAEKPQRRETASNKITSKAALGVDAVNPTNNYFYAEVNKFTLSAIAEAFELNIKLPKALMETGFPDGVIVSFTTSPKGMVIDS